MTALAKHRSVQDREEDFYVPGPELTQCALWEGSTLQSKARFHYLKFQDLVAKRDAMKRCDDLTPKERQFLAGIEAAIERRGK